MLKAYNSESGALCLALDVPQGEPPTNFQILGAGVTATTKRDVLFDDEARAAVSSAFMSHGMDRLPIDFDHGMLSPLKSADSSAAAGWFVPMVHSASGALMATDVQWTPRAAQMLRDREFRFFSPALRIENSTGRVTKLINVALTNLPATKDQMPLVANDKEPPKHSGELEHNMQKLFKLIGANDEGEAMVIASEWNRTGEQILTLTSTKTLADALAAIEANAKLPAEVKRLSDVIADRDKADADRDRDALIVTLSEDGKLPPALHEWAKTQSVESLTAFGEGAPVINEENHEQKAADKSPQLTDEDKHIAKVTGVSLEDFTAQRKLELSAKEGN
jgi:phage I-like protein